TSKAFTANWERPFKPAHPAPGVRRPEKASVAGGTLTNPSPVALEDGELIHGGSKNHARVYQRGTLRPSQSKPLHTPNDGQLPQWLSCGVQVGEFAVDSGLMRRIMFHGASASPDALHDRALHHLDERWRRSWKSGAMLVGRVARAQGPAENVTQEAVSPS